MAGSLKKENFANFSERLDKEIIRENKKLEKWMIENYGPRCSEFLKDCIVCQKWKIYDKLRIEI
jgi:hypothetical protein